MPVQWDEFQAAYLAWREQRESADRWMQILAAGEPFDRDQLERDLQELDASHKVMMERARHFAHPTGS